MAKTKISEFSSTPANNTDIDSINIAEGCAPSNINDAIRELMAQLKDFQIGSQGDSFNGPIGTSTAAAGAFTTLSASSTVTLSGGTANGVTYLNGSKVLTSGSALTFDGTTFSNVQGSGTAALSFNQLSFSRNGANYLTATLSSLNYEAATSHIFSQYGGSELMRLTSTGLGIGTSSPGTKLEVDRSTTAAASATGSTTRANSAISVAAGSDTNTRLMFGIDTNTNGWIQAQNTNSSGTASIILNPVGGNLGLGVTPSAWATFTGLQVGALGGVNIGGATGDNFYAMNAYYNTGWKYAATGYTALMYRMVNGEHRWSTAASGTAGNAISFTQAMTLDASGNLGVGTTSPATKLEVNGVVAGTSTGVDGTFAPVFNALYSSNTAFYGQIQHSMSSAATVSGFRFLGGGTSNISGSGGLQKMLDLTRGQTIFYTGDTERARIDSSGNLLIGTTSGSSKLTVEGASGNSTLVSMYNTSNSSGNQNLVLSLGANANNTSSYFLVCQTPAVANRLFIYGNGNVVNTNNSYGSLSDVKLKENIVDASPKLADLMQVQVRNYNLIGSTIKQIGVVAQELETVFPSMIDVSPDIDAEGNDLGTTTKSVKYSVFVPMLIKALQELKAEFDAYKALHP